MPGPMPARCTFPDDFLQEARYTVRRRTAAVQVVQRYRLVLLLAEQPRLRNEDAAEVVGLSPRQVQRWRSRWASGDFAIEDQPGRGRKPAFSPSGSSADPCSGLRSNRRNRRASEPAIAGRSGTAIANDVGPKDQPQHRVADAARGGHQAVAA